MDTSQAEFLFSDLYVKIYVMNISTQKKVIKKKTRVCRHDREPSFNETFRFSLSPAGHSLQVIVHYAVTI